MATRNLALRILYTINSSPQYILARSFAPIVATLVGEAPYQYATAPLKACLDAICRSSPELIQDYSRDYSIYVLDPLESNTAPTPISISSGAASSSNATSSAQSQAPGGVAVGLGLMSWALADSSDAVQATGTLIRLPTGQDAIEVIFALRETTATQKPPQPTPSASGSGWGTSSSPHYQTNAVASSSRTPLATSHQGHMPAPTDARTKATIASIQMRSQSKRPRSKKPVQRQDTLPSSEADRLLLAQDVYIGPVKKKGRPVRTPSALSFNNETKAHINLHDSGSATHSDASAPPPSDSSQQTATPGPTLQDIFSLLASTTAKASDPQHAALSTALGSIDSSAATQNSGQNPDLVNALKTLLTAVSHSQQEPSAQATINPTQPIRPRSPDDEIVVLDKENVNPTAFRKKSAEEKPQVASQPSQTENGRDRKLSNRSNTQPNTQPVPPAPTPPSSSTASSLGRKRTLSDYMDEREASKQRQKIATLADRRDAHRQAHSTRPAAESSAHRYYPRIVSGDGPRLGGTNSYYRTALECATSPLKASGSGSFLSGNRSQASENSNPFSQRSLMSSPTRPPRTISASSPVRPVAAKSRKPYVVPVWARTATATQPRLSEQAQRALEEQEKQKKEERAQRKAMRALNDRERKRHVARTPSPEPPSSSQENNVPSVMQPPRTPKRLHKPAPGPIAAMSYPVFANSSPVNSLSVFKTPSTPKRQTPLRVTPRVVSFPVTPTRRAGSMAGSPAGSLFTPGGLFTPKTPSAKSSLTASCSPTRRRSQPQSSDTQGSDGDVEDELDKELDSAMEELTSSQPEMTSGDDDDDDSSLDEDYVPSSSELSTSTAESSDTGSCTPTRPTTPPPREHWEGLPPSSPIPPSSPMHIPQDMDDDDDDDDRELPVATSEAEQDMAGNDTSGASTPLYDASPLPASEAEQTGLESEGDQDCNIFPDVGGSEQFGDLSAFNPESNFLDSFNDQNFGLQLSDAELAAFSDDFMQTSVDHDFTQFLESCKSLAPMCQTNNGEGSSLGDAAATLASLLENVDYEKLAEEVQGLYGGCVV